MQIKADQEGALRGIEERRVASEKARRASGIGIDIGAGADTTGAGTVKGGGSGRADTTGACTPSQSRHNGSMHSERRRQRQSRHNGSRHSGGSGRADTMGAGTVKGGGSGRAAHLCRYMYSARFRNVFLQVRTNCGWTGGNQVITGVTTHVRKREKKRRRVPSCVWGCKSLAGFREGYG